MTKTEKTFLVILVAIILGFGAITHVIFEELEKVGGVKAVVVAVGKEIKDIKTQINKEETK